MACRRSGVQFSLAPQSKIPSSIRGRDLRLPDSPLAAWASAATCPAPIVGRGVRREKVLGQPVTDCDACRPSAPDPAACSDPAGPALPGSRAFALLCARLRTGCGHRAVDRLPAGSARGCGGDDSPKVLVPAGFAPAAVASVTVVLVMRDGGRSESDRMRLGDHGCRTGAGLRSHPHGGAGRRTAGGCRRCERCPGDRDPMRPIDRGRGLRHALPQPP